MSSKPLATITEKTGYDDSHDDGKSSFVSHDDDDDFVLEMFAAMRLEPPDEELEPALASSSADAATIGAASSSAVAATIGASSSSTDAAPIVQWTEMRDDDEYELRWRPIVRFLDRTDFYRHYRRKLGLGDVEYTGGRWFPELDEISLAWRREVQADNFIVTKRGIEVPVEIEKDWIKVWVGPPEPKSR